MTSFIGHLSLGFIASRILKTNRSETLLLLIMSILPDFDTLFCFTGVLPWSFHRTVTHSLLFILAISFLLFLVKNKRFGYLCFTGLILHVLLDCCDSLGVPIFYPLPFRLAVGLWMPVYITLSGGFLREDLIPDYGLLLIVIVIELYKNIKKNISKSEIQNQ